WHGGRSTEAWTTRCRNSCSRSRPGSPRSGARTASASGATRSPARKRRSSPSCAAAESRWADPRLSLPDGDGLRVLLVRAIQRPALLRRVAGGRPHRVVPHVPTGAREDASVRCGQLEAVPPLAGLHGEPSVLVGQVDVEALAHVVAVRQTVDVGGVEEAS